MTCEGHFEWALKNVGVAYRDREPLRGISAGGGLHSRGRLGTRHIPGGRRHQAWSDAAFGMAIC